MFKKFLALAMACTLTVTMVACGDSSDKPSETTPTAGVTEAADPTATPAPTAAPAVAIDHSGDLPADAASYVNFEDGTSAFAAIAYSNAACNLASELSVVDFAGSKALKASSPVSDNVFSGVNPYLAIDVVSLLGDNAGKVAKVQYDIGIDHGTDPFSAVSGVVSMFTGENNTETKSTWSVYLEDQNPKVYTASVPEGGFIAGAKNYMCFTIETDNGSHAAIYVDNLVFYDKDGNVLAPDTKAAFAVEGLNESFWMNLDWSNGAKKPVDEVVLGNNSIKVGMMTGTGWWPQSGNGETNILTFVEANQAGSGYWYIDPATFTEGMVLTIYYEPQYTVSEETYWQAPYLRCQSWTLGAIADVFPPFEKEADGTVIQKDTYPRNVSETIIQYTYEQIAEACKTTYGDDAWQQYVDVLGVTDMGAAYNILKVTIGKAQ